MPNAPQLAALTFSPGVRGVQEAKKKVFFSKRT
jgi:hypothetical protein